MVLDFPNLRGDAYLIVPSGKLEESICLNISTFVREASDREIDELWKKVGCVFDRLITEENKWLSTAGKGVPWLHVRIDSRPKYYRFIEYRKY